VSTRTWFTTAGLLAVFAACRYQPTVVPLRGSASDVGALAGQWDGEYSSSESMRSGTITFTVRAGSDTAYGDVMMMPRLGQAIVAADAASQQHLEHASTAEAVRITFVQVKGGIVEGTLEPYVAPDCQCVVSTVFRGTVAGDHIDGTFTTRGDQGMRQDGRWRVARRAR
jgi:hypothetical protein